MPYFVFNKRQSELHTTKSYAADKEREATLYLLSIL